MIHQPSALITGANRGIGFETARQLGKKGFYIFLTARKNDEGEKARRKLEAESITAEFIQLDITSLESIRSAFEKVSRKISHLDVLINNAAILSKQDNDLLTVNSKIVSDTMNTNVSGALHVTQHFAPLLSKGCRVINLSSGGGSMTDPIGGWSPVYCISKSAVNALTRHLAYYLGEKNVAVNAACPGWVRTDMGGRSATRSVEKGAETIVWLASEAPHSLTGKFFRDKKEIPW
jgi:NAD(P)-dependent dehydrogenase (short-subunit alcohol dehydrogenase family)